MPSFTTIIDERFPALNQYDYRRLFINGFSLMVLVGQIYWHEDG